MVLKYLTPVAAVLILVSGGAANSAEHVLTQKAKKFDQKKMAIKKGDSIKFINSDSITHNIHSRSAPDKFDLGAQAPGTESKHTFDKAGKFKVRCAIHPKMKVTVKVN
jgi:plastocyanin